MPSPKTKNLQLKMTPNEYAAVVAAAEKRGMSASAFGAQMLLGCLLKERFRTEMEVLDKLNHFYKLFVRTMESGFAGEKPTAEMFRGWARQYPEDKEAGE